ncbi:MAG: MXAN_5187 C-terminal domain-containing protein [Kofleriaceae bacterium]
MASKQVRQETDVEELLDMAEQAIERLKTLYEQYFMGIQKQAPSFIHNDLERKLRDLAQMQLRNTGLRYRLATLQQKFGSYNSYWRRTLRQIENGTYARQLQKIGRDAVRTGAEIPEEILAAMPKRMRDQVVRDRDMALAIAKRRHQVTDDAPPEADDDFIAMIKEPTEVRRKLKSTDGAHLLDGGDADFDIDAFFAEVEQTDDKPVAPVRPRVATRQPMNRSRPTTTGDLIRSGTRPDSQQLAPIRLDSEPGMSPLPRRAETEPGGSRTATQPIQRIAKPPPIPGRATGAQPALAHPTDDKATAKQPAFARPPSVADDFGTPAPTRTTGAQPAIQRATGPQPPLQRATGPQPVAPGTGPQQTVQREPVVPRPAEAPRVPMPGPRVPAPMPPMSPMSSQASRPNPIAPGAAAARGDVPVESMAGPFPRAEPAPFTKTMAMPSLSKTPSTGIPSIPKPIPSIPRPSSGIPAIPKPDEPAVIVTKTPAVGAPLPNRTVAARTPAQGVAAVKPAPQKPPPGMTDADVNALYAKYVKAKEMVGEKIGPGEHNKLLKTINAQAPKIMEQYKAKGVDFSVVVKDNQVIIRAKPKT